jgi:hypothetical protein
MLDLKKIQKKFDRFFETESEKSFKAFIKKKQEREKGVDGLKESYRRK